MNWFGKNPGINSAEDRHLKQVAEEITRDIADGTLTQAQGVNLLIATGRKHTPERLQDGLNPIQAFAHYVSGSGKPLEVPFESVHLSRPQFEKNAVFQAELQALKQKAPSTKNLTLRNLEVGFGFDKPAEFSSYGRILTDAKGNLSVDQQGKWNFDGIFKQSQKLNKLDEYDFNEDPSRGQPAEYSTWVGSQFPGQKYDIYSTGFQRKQFKNP